MQTKHHWLPSKDRHVRMQLATRAMRTVDERGIEPVAAQLRGNGGRV